MESLLAKIKAGVKNERFIVFPGTNTKIGLRVLSNQDILDAALAADRIYKAAEVSVAFQNVTDYETEKDTQRLFRACFNPDTGEPVTTGISDFRRLLTQAERSALIEAYNDLDDECNPSPADMADEEFGALVETLKKNPSPTIGNCSSLRIAKRLLAFLANPPSTSLMGSGSIS